MSDWFSHSVAHDTKPWRGMLETPLGKVYEADEQKVAWEIRGMVRGGQNATLNRGGYLGGKDVMGTIACRIDMMFVRIGLGVVLHPVLLYGWACVV